MPSLKDLAAASYAYPCVSGGARYHPKPSNSKIRHSIRTQSRSSDTCQDLSSRSEASPLGFPQSILFRFDFTVHLESPFLNVGMSKANYSVSSNLGHEKDFNPNHRPALRTGPPSQDWLLGTRPGLVTRSYLVANPFLL